MKFIYFFLLTFCFCVFPVQGETSSDVKSQAQTQVESPSPSQVRPMPACPVCGSSENVVRIVYGYPSEKLMKEADEGKVKLGGCVIGGADPRFYCKKCDKNW
ncbi:MAG: hypothetical protein HYS08_04645 [Chlamydiae bacterium]|nr:hypothetical protein [Chlamydiota bacterium]MBI3265820.1 hypothetical protein [Chlamydiota bacterium]